MITSTITRPTSIAATSSCEQKVSLVETVDIGTLTAPKPRTISLEPISRRSRRKKIEKGKQVAAQEAAQDAVQAGPGSEAPRITGSPQPDESVSQNGDEESGTNPRSPVESEIISTASAATGTESTTSSSTGLSFRIGPVPSSARSTNYNSSASTSEKTITATIELLKSGCLPGESLPLKISIKHTKAIKSMHGIIITLYRQGRIDSAPPLSLFGNIKGKEAERLKHEEYYPKSKTGLGGLSLTSAGSSSVFRKDLAQTFAPILVDPTSLRSVVNASVRVPEDSFPTISGVPGEMISFKYHVEVVVDLGGKLAGQQRHVPLVGAIAQPSSMGASGGGRGDGNFNILTAMGGSIVDTDHIRREKSVVGCLFEVVIGSTDSARKRGRGSSFRTQASDWQEETPVSPGNTYDPIYEEYSSEQPHPYHYHDENYAGQHPEYPGRSDFGDEPSYQEYSEETPPAHTGLHIPPPELQQEEGLSDKERARLAEERLLPSQPPQEDGPSSPRTVVASTALSAPSAPPDDLNNDLYDAEDSTPPAPSASTMPLSSLQGHPAGPSAPPALSTPPTIDETPSAPGMGLTEDKQELERRRMLAEASAPSDFPAGEEVDENGGEGSSGTRHEASAPVLDEIDEYGGQYSHHALPASLVPHNEELPKYER